MAILNQIEIGEKIEVFFNLSSREFKFLFIDALKISKQAINNNSEIDNSEDEVLF